MQYFDKKFWKMSAGFIAIIAISLIIVFGAKIYEQRQIDQSIEANMAHPNQ